MAERLLDEKTLGDVKNFLEQMEGNVKAILFTNGNEQGQMTAQLITELSEAVNKITLDVLNIDDPLTTEYKIDTTLVPAMVMLSSDGKDHGVRFYGIPAGHEFSTLLADFVSMSKGAETDFSEEAVNKLKTVDKEVRIRVFVTPTCPYCPRAVIAAHHAAIVNDKITGDMIEANEFFDISTKHNVSSVPHTIIEVNQNGEWIKKGEFVGAFPEANFVEQILTAVK